MSRSFTVKPAVSQTRGRGRGRTEQTQRQPVQPVRHGPNKNMEPEPEAGTDGTPKQPQQEGLQQRMSYQGGFTMISPNEKKRQEISQQARREEEAYNRHKEQSKVKHVSYIGTVGGGQITQETSRRQLAQVQQASKFNSLQNRQKYKDSVRQRENESIMKKKEEQRRKSEMNQHRESNRQSTMTDDHRAKNEAFLKRLEGQQKITKNKEPTRSAETLYMTQGNTESSHDRGAEGCDSDPSQLNAAPADMARRMKALQTMYPDYNPSMLQEILRQMNFSVDAAISLLEEDE